ncbi:unnamed protein product [Adineta steineri]|uniref:Cytosine deaminase n=1 Tax=Adineta steineri TaxID=433720 RepID=A0A813X5G2_9BILA|nr:unnamed protein product [Adineta steineri]
MAIRKYCPNNSKQQFLSLLSFQFHLNISRFKLGIFPTNTHLRTYESIGDGEGGIPIGCVLVRNGEIIARGHNRRIQRSSVILHAEMDCLESAGRQTAAFYKECTIYTTLSPCAMCSGAIRLYGIPRVVIGENKTFVGDETLLQANHVHIDVLDSKECYDLLQDYINKNHSTWYEDIGRE